MRTVLSSIFTIVALILAATPVSAQAPNLSGLQFREVGPAVFGGRVADLAVDESDNRIIYVGTATGGVWKTTNHGITWEPIFTDQETASIGDVTLAPSNPNTVWVGTGEPQNRQSSPWGFGVYRSLDGGSSWQHMGLEETHHISRIRIDPRNADVVYVAAVGNLWAPSEGRGVYRTRDAGASWEKVLFINDDTGIIDLAMDPDDPNTLFAAAYQRRRTPGGFNGGGPGSGIYRSYDGGDSWELLTDGLPEGNVGRIGLDVYRRDGNLVYAVVQATRGQQGVYRSEDRGDTWEKMSDTNPRPMYYSQIRIDPNNPDKILLGGANMFKSEDAGRTFTQDGAPGVHLDHHAIWIDPYDSNHLLSGNDGGVATSFDGGTTWRMYDNLPISQFYEIGVNTDTPYMVCGGLQDNGTWCAPTDTRNGQGIRNADWFNIHGGDGFYAQPDPTNPRIVYAESQNGNVSRTDIITGERASIRPQAETDEEGVAVERFRWNWNTPLIISQHDPNTVYTGSNKVFKSTDQGRSWIELSGDITRNFDRDTIRIMGEVPSDSMLSRHDGTSFWSTITTIGESPLNPDLVYAGTDDGNVQVTRDGGQTWVDLTDRFPGLPPMTYVSRLEPSGGDEATVYASFDGHQTGDFKPYVYRSDDSGESWELIVNGLPLEWSVNVITQHPRSPHLLFVGTEIGVYYSTDHGDEWNRLRGGLPTVPVDDILIHPAENDLVLGTHGRGIWVMADITPLEGLTPEVITADATLFPIRTSEMYNTWNPQGWPAAGEFRRPNAPVGARIRYFIGGDAAAVVDPETDGDVQEQEAETVSLTILDPAGEEIRTLEGPGSAGLHEVRWDFRIEAPYEPAPGQGGGGFGGSPRGPKVLPGSYTVRLDAGGGTQSQQFEVIYDIRIPISNAALEARFNVLMELYHAAEPVYLAGQALRSVNEQLNAVAERLDDSADPPEALRDQLEEVRDEVRQAQQRFQRLGSVNGFMRTLESVSDRPTSAQMEQIAGFWTRLPSVIEEINSITSTSLPALHQTVNAGGLMPEEIGQLSMPRRGGN